jgi:hypothetical protein
MTIADHARLTTAVPWEVEVTLAADDSVAEVDFLIDGTKKWVEQNSPYFFNDDHQVLAPWLLGQGAHQLTAHVVTAGGKTADVTANVDVRANTSRNKLIAGTYHRTVTQGDLQRVLPYRTPDKGAFGEASPTGRWTLQIKPDGEILGRDPIEPEGIPFIEPYTLTGSTMRLYGAADWRQKDPSDRSLFCEPERASDYTWSLSGSSLTIRSTQKVCADRDTVFVGTWTKG